MGEQERRDRGAEHLHGLREAGEPLGAGDLLGEHGGHRDADGEAEAAEGLGRHERAEGAALDLLDPVVGPADPADDAAGHALGAAADPARDPTAGALGGLLRQAHPALPASRRWVIARSGAAEPFPDGPPHVPWEPLQSPAPRARCARRGRR